MRDGGAAGEHGAVRVTTALAGCPVRQCRGRRRHAELVRAVMNLLKLYGCSVVPVKQGPTPRKARDGSVVFCRGQLRPGVSDVIACGPRGRFVAVECKIGRDALRPAQVRFLADVRQRNGVALVAHDNVQAVIDAEKQIREEV